MSVRIDGTANDITGLTAPLEVGSATASGDAVQKAQLDGGVTNSANGMLGERKEATVPTINAPATGTWGDLTSVSFGIGTWDISAQFGASANGATTTATFSGGLGTVTGNSSTGLVAGDTQSYFSHPTATDNNGSAIAPKRYVFAAPTTIYLKMQAAYSAGTPIFFGRLTGVRVAL